tara:strand:- start:23 stop:751 length:729 start_codon:yes stop_codon:yes gene_type:complete
MVQKLTFQKCLALAKIFLVLTIIGFIIDAIADYTEECKDIGDRIIWIQEGADRECTSFIGTSFYKYDGSDDGDYLGRDNTLFGSVWVISILFSMFFTLVFFSIAIIIKIYEWNQNAIVSRMEHAENTKIREIKTKEVKAKERESAKDYDAAIRIWEELGEIGEAARIRTLKAEQGAVKVAQKVVHGDEVTKTEIKDSVLNRSNVGAGGEDKITKIKELKELHDAGAIDDDEFKQMKKEILGK